MAIDPAGLKAQYRKLRPEITAALEKVLDHGQFIMGPEVARLEEELKDYAGAGHCVSCASGTDALILPLMAWGIGLGDAVFVPDFTFFATAEVVALLGATPVFVDIDPKTFNMDAAGLEAAIRAVETGDASDYPLPARTREGRLRPRAVIPVDLFGLPADYGGILPIARKYGLKVLEDAAQSFGGSWNGGRACGLGCDAAATSFFPSKPLGCYGDGGAVFTGDHVLAEAMASIRVHGRGSHKYDNARIGLNARLDTMQAAVLLAKLKLLDDEIAARNDIADRYSRGLKGCGAAVPEIPPSYGSAWAQYSILVPERDRLAETLGKAGVPTAVYYPKPLHRQKALAYLGYAEDDFPVSADISRRIVSLPMQPYLTSVETEHVIRSVRDCLSPEVHGSEERQCCL